MQQNEIPDIFKDVNLNNSIETDNLSQRAEDVISGLRGNFVSSAKESILRMGDILKMIRDDEVAQSRVLPDSFFRMAHDIKGQGTTFGYPLLTELGVDICDILRGRTSWSRQELNRIEQDLADMHTVINMPYDSKGLFINKIKQRLKEK